MQMDSVETNAGAATCCAESRMARVSGLPSCMLRCVFSISTVASSTRMPTASASPPSVITLMVSPQRRQDDERCRNRKRNGNANDEGRPPRAQEQQDHQAGERSGDQRFADDLIDAGAHKDRLVKQRRDLQIAKTLRRKPRNHFLRVGKQYPALKSGRSSELVSSADRLPSCANDVCLLRRSPCVPEATSFTYTTAPFEARIGRSFNDETI